MVEEFKKDLWYRFGSTEKYIKPRLTIAFPNKEGRVISAQITRRSWAQPHTGLWVYPGDDYMLCDIDEAEEMERIPPYEGEPRHAN